MDIIIMDREVTCIHLGAETYEDTCLKVPGLPNVNNFVCWKDGELVYTCKSEDDCEGILMKKYVGSNYRNINIKYSTL